MQMTITTPRDIERIRDLNDRARRTFVGCVVIVTQGVDSLCREVKAEVLRRVRMFDHFNGDNDPHSEHDFGSFNIAGTTFAFKWDYYDRQMEGGSENPGDTSKTTRVLTVMRLDEY